jgi:hypothetical protein
MLNATATPGKGLMGKPRKKRPHADTTVPHVPASPEDIMAALLRTPPPPAGDKSTRKTVRKKAAKRKGRR